jgi:hypothetical protein
VFCGLNARAALSTTDAATSASAERQRTLLLHARTLKTRTPPVDEISPHYYYYYLALLHTRTRMHEQHNNNKVF